VCIIRIVVGDIDTPQTQARSQGLKVGKESMAKFTNRQIAESFQLWQEYIDPMATMTEEQFDALTVEERERMIEEMFGPDEDDE
jgi:5'-deoxynucleotidase YfbR-like HD superfamily hydrolase